MEVHAGCNDREHLVLLLMYRAPEISAILRFLRGLILNTSDITVLRAGWTKIESLSIRSFDEDTIGFRRTSLEFISNRLKHTRRRMCLEKSKRLLLPFWKSDLYRSQICQHKSPLPHEILSVLVTAGHKGLRGFQSSGGSRKNDLNSRCGFLRLPQLLI